MSLSDLFHTLADIAVVEGRERGCILPHHESVGVAPSYLSFQLIECCRGASEEKVTCCRALTQFERPLEQ